MPRYILRPRQGHNQIASLVATRRSLRPGERARQVKEILDTRRELGMDVRFAWFADAGTAVDTMVHGGGEMAAVLREGTKLAASAVRVRGATKGASRTRTVNAGATTRGRVRRLAHLPVSGTDIVEMSEAEATRFRREMTDFQLLEDQRLSLIRPVGYLAADAALAATEPTDLNWVRQMVHSDQALQGGFTGQGVTVAVLDTGVDGAHPEVAAALSGAVRFHDGKWEGVKPSADTLGHGTHVAGILAGRTIGVAPGASVVSCIMIPGGAGWTSDFIAALEWAAQTPAIQVVNMSAGLVGFHPEMMDAVKDVMLAGVVAIIASGNEGRNQTRSPGNYDVPLSVGACGKNRRVASFSSGGRITYDNHVYSVPDVVAPGVNLYSSIPVGGYKYDSGTSMATPVVAGVAALLLQKYPSVSAAELVDALVATCEDLSEHEDRQGRGLVSYTGADAYLAQVAGAGGAAGGSVGGPGG
jgi:subtilisin family serine protease